VNAEKAAQLVMEPYRLEGFDAALRGRRLFVVGVDAGLRRFAALESESLYRGKNVLVHGDGHAPFTVGRRKWDAVFRMKDAFDAQMIATYVANAAKPVRVFWFCSGAGHDSMPRALWSKWVKQDITLIGCSEGTAPLAEWDAIFFPHSCELATVERVLSARGVGGTLLTIREHVSELAASGAALVWSNIDGTDARGGLYWYDPDSVADISTGFTRIEIGQMLEAVRGWVVGTN